MWRMWCYLWTYECAVCSVTYGHLQHNGKSLSVNRSSVLLSYALYSMMFLFHSGYKLSLYPSFPSETYYGSHILYSVINCTLSLWTLKIRKVWTFHDVVTHRAVWCSGKTVYNTWILEIYGLDLSRSWLIFRGFT